MAVNPSAQSVAAGIILQGSAQRVTEDFQDGINLMAKEVVTGSLRVSVTIME